MYIHRAFRNQSPPHHLMGSKTCIGWSFTVSRILKTVSTLIRHPKTRLLVSYPVLIGPRRTPFSSTEATVALISPHISYWAMKFNSTHPRKIFQVWKIINQEFNVSPLFNAFEYQSQRLLDNAIYLEMLTFSQTCNQCRCPGVDSCCWTKQSWPLWTRMGSYRRALTTGEGHHVMAIFFQRCF